MNDTRCYKWIPPTSTTQFTPSPEVLFLTAAPWLSDSRGTTLAASGVLPADQTPQGTATGEPPGAGAFKASQAYDQEMAMLVVKSSTIT